MSEVVKPPVAVVLACPTLFPQSIGGITLLIEQAVAAIDFIFSRVEWVSDDVMRGGRKQNVNEFLSDMLYGNTALNAIVARNDSQISLPVTVVVTSALEMLHGIVTYIFVFPDLSGVQGKASQPPTSSTMNQAIYMSLLMESNRKQLSSTLMDIVNLLDKYIMITIRSDVFSRIVATCGVHTNSADSQQKWTRITVLRALL
jgi:hypothetical protein